ncbi:response regulator [Clostridium beijerinckii]|jgi:Response regulators consisting of a CheY-like receiver domain and a winged-helix DNA-binding domain|uniref:Stage 0 sporulation protein A homolog n=2 Tax=Clostridium beijerinckii TaxID=1520 RepID=A0A1S8QFD3_CLOBE|nr:response regulator [Clostridium beijerinckii]ABR34197.1 two component transcriptional regulator, winged helix family [Clostridium beijerinckii NCIMB 8052]AIU03726.1 two component transcriptional regulator [Clostridium beijerinckii ATCC 35702]MBF7811196.1 response regulator [Clostridium beijerinckii]NOW91936.1 two-component system KDP operon response regulator KdpE [Clostridium beijerinckii]NRT24499.1 two-component system KDP operon response regulator KdpE [Clostridium beijerinckii]
MDNKPYILVVEDDRPIRNFIAASLKTQGFNYIETDKGVEAVALTMSHKPDLIILDLGLPDIDGVDVITRVREWSKVPIIIVSARENERQKIEALDKGADDYLTKPFGIGELLARIRVSLRHSRAITNEKENAEIFKVKGLTVDFSKRKVTIDNEDIHLTPIEYKIMALLCKYAGKVLTHNFIINEIWGAAVGNETQSLRVFMASLRRKIEKNPAEPKYIYTEVGVGYRLADD